MTVKVQRYNILCSKQMVYDAWEPTSWIPSGYAHAHSTLFRIDGVEHGRIGCRRLPDELEALPAMTEERSRRVKEWLEAQYAEAYALIEKAFPETVGRGYRSMGDISINWEGPLPSNETKEVEG